MKKPEGKLKEISGKRRRGLLISIVILLLSVGVILYYSGSVTPKTAVIFESNAVTGSSRTGIIVPLFSQNNSESQVNEVIQTKVAHPNLPFIVVVNFGNGPGIAYDSGRNSEIKSMQSANITVLGYVPTGWGKSNLSTIEHGMATFYNWYRVDGIYLDEMVNWEFGSSGQYLPPFYSELTGYGKSLGMKEVIGNSGADVPYFFVGSVDRIGVFENAFTPPVSYFAGWHLAYNKSNFWFVSYNISSVNPYYVASSSDYVSYLFLTNGEKPYPYASLPPYFPQLVSDLDSLVPITIKSVTLGGAPIPAGFEVNVTQPDGISNSALTPAVFNVVSGSRVTVTVQDHAGFVFDHWSDGNTQRTRTLNVTQAATLIAYSKTSVRTTAVVAVHTVATDGTPVTGVWTVASAPNGTIAAAGYTPFAFEGNRSTKYTISVANYQNLSFVDWNNAPSSGQRSINVTPTQNVILTASFKRNNSTANPTVPTVTTASETDSFVDAVPAIVFFSFLARAFRPTFIKENVL